jgi:hypothetical protein
MKKVFDIRFRLRRKKKTEGQKETLKKEFSLDKFPIKRNLVT